MGPQAGGRQDASYPRHMQFSRDLRDDVITGDITVSFRLWRRPKVKAGGWYPGRANTRLNPPPEAWKADPGSPNGRPHADSLI